MGRAYSTYDSEEKAIENCEGWGEPEGNSPLGIHRCKWKDNIKIDFK